MTRRGSRTKKYNEDAYEYILKAALLRRRILEKCKCLGFEIEDEKNNKAIEKVVQDIGKEARHRTLVCQTDEQVRGLISA